MSPTTRDLILKSRPKPEPVEVPEWGGTVYVQPMVVADLLEVLGATDADPARRTAEIVARSTVDASGDRLFLPGDVDALLGSASAAGLLKVSAVALRANALRKEDQEALGKLSAPTGDGATSSGSPASSAAPSSS